MSEKGILSKSIANNISEAIIDKLGGTGYTPTEWSKNINLLGISSADIEEALASITEDTSSSDKGLLSLSTASDMGAILNKKYNTSRGFKPSEVSSAVSALTPLPEKTASGSIVTFSDGAEDVPTKPCEVALSPSLDGYTEVDVVQTGKNLMQSPTLTASMDSLCLDLGKDMTFPELTLSFLATNAIVDNVNSAVVDYRENSGTHHYRTLNSFRDANNVQFVASSANNGVFKDTQTNIKFRYVYISYTTNTRSKFTSDSLSGWQLEIGSSASSYEPYTTPTTYTASLGRTIYGGTADIVNGTGIAWWALHKVTSSDGIYDYATGNGFRVSTSTWAEGIMKAESNNGGICNEFDTVTNNTNRGVRFSIGDNTSIYFVQVYSEIGNTVEAFKTWLDNHDVYVVYPIATPTDFAFDGQEINTRLGYNAFWSDEGDTEVTYRADIDLYEAPSMLLGANNTETEGNEEQEVNE